MQCYWWEALPQNLKIIHTSVWPHSVSTATSCPSCFITSEMFSQTDCSLLHDRSVCVFISPGHCLTLSFLSDPKQLHSTECKICNMFHVLNRIFSSADGGWGARIEKQAAEWRIVRGRQTQKGGKNPEVGQIIQYSFISFWLWSSFSLKCP